MCEADKRFAEMLVGAFGKAIEEQREAASPVLEYGRELLGVPEQSGLGAMWISFYCGFGKGAEFMAAANADPKGTRTAPGVG